MLTETEASAEARNETDPSFPAPEKEKEIQKNLKKVIDKSFFLVYIN